MPTYIASDALYLFKSFHGQPTIYERVEKCINGCDAIMLKTCMEMEGRYIEFKKSLNEKNLLLAGPLVSDSPKGELVSYWLNRLAKFPKGSVIFSSFGSETFLSEEGAKELLLGLKMSGFPFIVVLNFSKGEDQNEMLKKIIPDGFEERVRGRGLVQCGWVPQQLILRHESVGCFLCHAGFSSVLEGLISNCQLVMLPQKGDQFLNSLFFAYDLKVGVEVERREEDGGYVKEAIMDAIESAMVMDDGDVERVKVRENHKKWREFLMDEKVQERFIADLMEELKNIVAE
ncbi:hypothetical protein LUZ60_007996 [Juncus effusus]|nr:hypothetical protein LUZ60_007996 [Juncus effusus]